MKNKTKTETTKQGRRIHYLANHTKILEAYKKLINTKGRKPTATEISQISGVNLRTVKRHIQTVKSELYMSDFRILSDEIVIALYEKAKEGRAPEVKLWMQLIENWRETQGITHSGAIKFEKINFVMSE